MRSRTRVVAAAVLVACAGQARADGVALPTLALQPVPTPSTWAGLHIGTEVSGVAGGRGAKGGFGSAVTAGYDHALADGVVLGVEGAAGHAPFAFAGTRARGFDFARAEVRLGYDMGRVMPFVTGGVALLKPSVAPGPGLVGPGASFNDLINGTAHLKAAATAGVGVDYAVTDDLHVGVAVSVTRAPAPPVP